MSRQGRLHLEGGIYHVIQRGIERRELFKNDSDREEFIKRLIESLKYSGHKCYGWALMPNHFHLVIRTGTKKVSDLMMKLSTSYALYFNKKYARSGYLYQGRYKSILCQEDSYLMELIRYVHLNPLRARIVKDTRELGTYKWSGHSVIMGTQKAQWQSTDEVLSYFGKKRTEAMKKYEIFVAEAKDVAKRQDLTGGGLLRSAGGWRGVMDLKRSKEMWMADERILGDGDFVSAALRQAGERFERKDKLRKEGWDIERLVKRVCELIGVDPKDIQRKSKRSKLSQARSLVAYWGSKELGISGIELAKYFQISGSSISEAIVRGEKIVKDNQYLIT
jgi:REP element-mobilizing transposase RayT